MPRERKPGSLPECPEVRRGGCVPCTAVFLEWNNVQSPLREKGLRVSEELEGLVAPLRGECEKLIERR